MAICYIHYFIIPFNNGLSPPYLCHTLRVFLPLPIAQLLREGPNLKSIQNSHETKTGLFWLFKNPFLHQDYSPLTAG